MTIPGPINNSWFDESDADTVFVFVHGILSDSERCWQYRSPETDGHVMTWPRLVRGDGRLGSPAIFLGGYTTNIATGRLRIVDAARQLFLGLSNPTGAANRAPLSKRSILFVCHSLGGVVARYLIERRRDLFKDKNLGIYLVASPSTGSTVATYFSSLMQFYNLQLGLQLENNSDALEDLDDRFRDLVEEGSIPRLVGVEAFEHHLVVPRRGWQRWLSFLLPRTLRVVAKDSASRYFGAAHLLADTDHSSAVKPSDVSHPAHQVLVDFFLRRFQPLAVEVTPTSLVGASITPPVLPMIAPPREGRQDMKDHIYSMREYFNALSTVPYRLKSLVIESRYSADYSLFQKLALTVEAVGQPLAAITATRSVDAPVDNLSDLRVRVSCEDPTAKVFWCAVEDEPTVRRFVFLIHPPLEPGRELTIFSSYQWPEGGRNLRQRGLWDVIEYTPPAQLADPIASLKLQLKVPDDGRKYWLRYGGAEQQFSEECEWSQVLTGVKSGQIVSLQTAWKD